MNEQDRLPLMRAGVAEFICTLPRSARIAIVQFNHQAKTLMPLTTLDDSVRQKALGILLGLKASGGTDITSAAIAALDLNGIGTSPSTIVLLSDGTHTGQGSTAIPESVWGPEAARILERAARQKVQIHTIGLGPDADTRLLSKLASARGEYFPIADSKDLLKQFVNIAAQVGKFWHRDQAGEFLVHHEEEVCCVTGATGSTRHDGLHRVIARDHVKPLTPVFEATLGGIRAQRFRLTPGSYRFTPDRAGTDLLRPMDLALEMPTAKALPAGRLTKLHFKARPSSPDADILDLRLRLHGKHVPDASAAADKAGSVVIPISTPAKPGTELTLQAVVEQRGWHCRLGELRFMLGLPAPWNVVVTSVPATLDWSTTPTEKATFRVEVRRDPSAVGLRLVPHVDHSDLEVLPAEIALDEPTAEIPMKVQFRQGIVAPTRGKWTGAIQWRVKGDDLAPPQVNGHAVSMQPFSWERRLPQFRFRRLATSVTARRGQTLFIPLDLIASDLHPTERGASVRLQGVNADGGITATLGVDADLKLALSLAKTLLPGRHNVKLTFASTDPRVSLADDALDLAVDVLPVQLELSLIGIDRFAWISSAAPASREVKMALRCPDGGPLPFVTFKVDSDLPIAASPLAEAFGERRSFVLTLPAFARPAHGNLRVRVDGQGAQPCGLDIPVEVRAPKVRVTADLTRLRTTVFGMPLPEWLDFGTEARLTLRGAGDWDEAGISYSLVADDANVSIIHGTQREFDSSIAWDSAWEKPRLLLQRANLHAIAEPGNAFDLIVHEELSEISTWLKFLVGASVCLVVVICLWPLSLRVEASPGLIFGLSRWGRLSVGPLIGVADLRLVLKRTWFGTRVQRHRRDTSGCRVDVAGTLLAPGASLPIVAGECLKIVTTTGECFQVVVGPVADAIDGANSDPDDVDLADIVRPSRPSVFD
jgi:uncharacterized protein YegL